MGHMKVRVGGTPVPLDGVDGVAVFEHHAEVDDPALPYVLQMDVAIIHGKPVCTGLTATRRPGGQLVTRRGLNALPVDRLVREVAAAATVRISRGPGYVAYDLLPADEDGNVAEDLAAEVAAGLAPRRGGGRRADPEAKRRLMLDVVQEYKDLCGARESRPKPVIAKSQGISRSYVSALLAQARREGLLGAATPGKASTGN